MSHRLANLAKRSLWHGGIVAGLRRRSRTDRAVVLRYHSVSPSSPQTRLWRKDDIAVSPELFERQMAYLAAHYHVCPLREVVERLGGEEAFEPRTVVITFDDGYMDNYIHALPVLRRYGLPATVFVVSSAVGDGWRFWVARLRALMMMCTATTLSVPGLGRIDLHTPAEREAAAGRLTAQLKRLATPQRDEWLDRLEEASGIAAPPPEAAELMMDWPQLREMAEAGIEIASHTHTHPILTRQSDAVVEYELTESKRLLEAGLGRPVTALAYPNGGNVVNHNRRIARAARRAGYRSAGTSINGPVRTGDDPCRLLRISVRGATGLPGFAVDLERDRLGDRLSRAGRPSVLLVGPPTDARTGIASCVRAIQRSPLRQHVRFRHISPTGPHGHYELGRFGKLGWQLRALAGFIDALGRDCPDLVQVHTSHYGDFWRNAPFVLAAVLMRRPLLIIIHGSRFDRFVDRSGRIKRWSIGWLLRRADHVLVRGESWRRWLQSAVPGVRVGVMVTTTDPVEEKRDCPSAEHQPLLLFVGGSPQPADCRRKGLEDLLAVMPQLQDRSPRPCLRVIGPRREPPWTGMLQHARLNGAVEFAGPQPPQQMAGHFRDASMLVLPSYAEGMPNVVLEAMAHGLPVVASNVGAIGEALEHGRGGLLIPPGDRPALVRSIAELLDAPVGAWRMGEHNRQRVARRFSHRVMAAVLLRAYREMSGSAFRHAAPRYREEAQSQA